MISNPVRFSTDILFSFFYFMSFYFFYYYLLFFCFVLKLKMYILIHISEYHVFHVFFWEKPYFIYCLTNKVIFSGKGNIIFSDNTRTIIFQRNFFGKTIFLKYLEKENLGLRAVSAMLGKIFVDFFYFLAQFIFTTSGKELDYYHQKWMYELLHKFSNDWRLDLRKLGNFTKQILLNVIFSYPSLNLLL